MTTYDLGDRQITMVTGGQGSTASPDTVKYYPDPAGLVDSIRTRHHSLIRNKYDAAGRGTLLEWSAKTDTFATPTGTQFTVTVPGDSIRRTFDAIGNLLTATDTLGTITRRYNLEGTLRSERQQVTQNPGIFHDVTVRFMYDLSDRRTLLFNGEDTVSYRYGSDGRLSVERVKWMSAGVAPDSFSFFWDGAGRRDSVIYWSNSVNVSYGYDRDGHTRMVCSRHSGGPSPDYLNHTLFITGLDSSGNVTGMQDFTNNSGNCSATGGSLVNWITTAKYDARNEVVQAIGLDSVNYSYDSSANIVALVTSPGHADTFAMKAATNQLASLKVDTMHSAIYNYNADHEMISVAAAHTPSRQSPIFFHNAIGQMIGDSTWISSVDSVGSLTTCGYDALGRGTRPCSGLTGWVLFDGDNQIASCCSYWRYAQGPEIDDPLVGLDSVSNSLTKYYYLTDGRGRLITITTASGAAVDTGTTVFFGASVAGAISNSETFQSSRDESPDFPGFSDFRNRYYDQATGRFLEEDPTGVANGLNLYGYVGNNPTTNTDPYGTGWLARVLVAVGAFVVTTVLDAASNGFSSALIQTATATTAVAAGSAVSAGVSSAVFHTSFLDTFSTDFMISESFLAVGAIGAKVEGGGVKAVGHNGWFNGYVVPKESYWREIPGTLGSATAFESNTTDWVEDTKIPVKILKHELGHTLEFFGLSAALRGFNPWLAYMGLGIPGMLGWEKYNPWEEAASALGKIF